MKNLVLLGLLFLSSCASSSELPSLNAETLYKRDMIVTINGIAAEGSLVVPKADKYAFHVEARGNLDLFTMKTCHREQAKERAWNVQTEIKTGPFGWGRRKIDVPTQVDFEFSPTDLEANGNCLMELEGYEYVKGRHSWALIDFENPFFSLPAVMECNGVQYPSKGTTICQTHQGILSRITFPEDTEVSSENKCKIDTSSDNRVFKFTQPLGRCVAVFASKSTPKKLHKLILFGYESIMVRNPQ